MSKAFTTILTDPVAASQVVAPLGKLLMMLTAVIGFKAVLIIGVSAMFVN